MNESNVMKYPWVSDDVFHHSMKPILKYMYISGLIHLSMTQVGEPLDYPEQLENVEKLGFNTLPICCVENPLNML